MKFVSYTVLFDLEKTVWHGDFWHGLDDLQAPSSCGNRFEATRLAAMMAR